ncbi:MAG: hypothetical protein IIB07_05230 [Bacteroidetes bacterium]|nr:hypothetical protein [Bacteroidota bacterium]
METKSSILELAEREFKTLSDAEKKFFQAVAEGNAADYTTGNTKKDNPALAQNWKDDRVLKSDRIEWICTDPEASKKVTRKGVDLIGLRIDGVLDLSHSNIPFQLIFDQCAFLDSIDLNNASIKSLYFLGTHTGPINGYFLKVAGSVFMRDGFKAEGEVNLMGATIGG